MSRFYEIGVADAAEIDDDRTAEWMESELRNRSVLCDICGAEDFAPEATLKRKGWLLGREEICPMHD